MAKIKQIATIQIIVDEDDRGMAADGISEILSQNPWVFDWSYLRVNGQYLTPTEIVVNDDYEEGEAFNG